MRARSCWPPRRSGGAAQDRLPGWRQRVLRWQDHPLHRWTPDQAHRHPVRTVILPRCANHFRLQLPQRFRSGLVASRRPCILCVTAINGSGDPARLLSRPEASVGRKTDPERAVAGRARDGDRLTVPSRRHCVISRTAAIPAPASGTVSELCERVPTMFRPNLPPRVLSACVQTA